ncbi:hypothetical protein [Mahella australiensis]|uniref:Uncharacterized protein n=1 Tax=Mahella australiensis (strain DSM 15567 / CIP 107919 / 50-1 BON) TaxID=697281 RepID=F3ZZG9_MAHA5|nr:hypothetical protein [Mahella australiensis]AEE95779.1 hypothetical protein Mahau_0576 [Mahella australiensis 50-1 BON]
MTSTPELITRLRKLLNEPIPPGGSEEDTNFLDADIETLLMEAANIYSAAAAGWTMKAGMLQGQIESYTVGQERYDMTGLKDQLEHALTMARQYADMAKISGGSIILKIMPPEVL